LEFSCIKCIDENGNGTWACRPKTGSPALKPRLFGLTDAYDMLEARRKIAREVTRIKRYKSDKAA
jgi:hypothetical protein